LIVGVALLWWATSRTGGLGVVLAASSALTQGPAELSAYEWTVHVFLPGLTAMVGFWATLSLNIPDFTRYCRSQREQLLGQMYGLPTTMLLFSFIGVAVTSATLILYKEAIWNPVELVVRMSKETGSTALAVLAMLTLAIATLSTNIAANVVGPANSLANAFPRALDFRRGGLVAAVLGIFVCPWLLLDVYTAWLVSYSGLLGAVSGVLLTDYWVVRRTELDLAGLYRSDGPYAYDNGFNVDAMLAMAAGIAVVLLGKLVPALEFLFSGAWFSGFIASAAVYLARVRRR
jgi:NCS1 family nucleobase:cation symporter-1